MTKLLLSGIAAVAFAASAATTYAQDPQNDIDVTVEIEKSEAHDAMDTSEDMDMTMDSDMSDSKASDMSDMAEAWDETAEDEADKNLKPMKDGMHEAVPSTDITPCPEGTKAQADGSCMVTEDWAPED